MAVFPESMNKLDYNNTGAALHIVEQYIGYMRERMEFAMTQMTRNVDAAGTTSTEFYMMLIELGESLAAMQSTVQSMRADLNTANGKISTMETQISNLQGNISTINGQISTINGQVSTISGQISTINGTLVDHEARIAALEGGGEP